MRILLVFKLPEEVVDEIVPRKTLTAPGMFSGLIGLIGLEASSEEG